MWDFELGRSNRQTYEQSETRSDLKKYILVYKNPSKRKQVTAKRISRLYCKSVSIVFNSASGSSCKSNGLSPYNSYLGKACFRPTRWFEAYDRLGKRSIDGAPRSKRARPKSCTAKNKFVS